MGRHHEQVSRAFDESREEVYRYLVTLGLPPHQAQEAAQEAFLRLFIALERGDSILNIRAWLFRVAHNLGIDLRRKDQLLPIEEGLEHSLRDTSRGVEMELMERERMDSLESSWKTLSSQQRQCLHLRAEGLRYREIAEAMGISISSVREFLGRAVLRLQKAVNG